MLISDWVKPVLNQSAPTQIVIAVRSHSTRWKVTVASPSETVMSTSTPDNSRRSFEFDCDAVEVLFGRPSRAPERRDAIRSRRKEEQEEKASTGAGCVLCAAECSFLPVFFFSFRFVLFQWLFFSYFIFIFRNSVAVVLLSSPFSLRPTPSGVYSHVKPSSDQFSRSQQQGRDPFFSLLLRHLLPLHRSSPSTSAASLTSSYYSGYYSYWCSYSRGTPATRDADGRLRPATSRPSFVGTRQEPRDDGTTYPAFAATPTACVGRNRPSSSSSSSSSTRPSIAVPRVLSPA